MNYEIINIFIFPIISSIISSGIIGILITHYFKQKEKEFLFADRIFDKKIQIYEVLYSKLQEASTILTELVEDDKSEMNLKNELWFKTVIKIMNFLDDNSMYVNEFIIVHIGAILTGVHSIFEEGFNQDNLDNEITEIRKGFIKSYEMIKEDVGIKRLEDKMTKINKPKLNSDIIRFYKSLKNKSK